MAHINVQIPDDMAEDMEEHVEASGRYMNNSEYVRDAIRHQMDEHPLHLSEGTLRDVKISEQQFERGEYHTHDDVKDRLGIED